MSSQAADPLDSRDSQLSLQFHSATFRRAVRCMGRRHGLGPGETRLLSRLLQGLELGTIAVLYELDPQTVSAAVTRLVHKCGVVDRTSLLLQFMLLLDAEAHRTEHGFAVQDQVEPR